jgi:hypothetical protein
MMVPVETEGTAETLIRLHQTTRRHDRLHRHHHDTLCPHSGLLYKLKVLSVCRLPVWNWAIKGRLPCMSCYRHVVGFHSFRVFLHVRRWVCYVLPSICLFVCRHGADINAATLQTCRNGRKYYFFLLLSLLTQSDLYCYQREFFY